MKRTVVLVDDHLAFRAALRGFLSESDLFEIVDEMQNGRELLDRKIPGKCDLILMDIAMPVMDGFEALRHIPAVYPEARTVIITGREEKAYREAAAGLGAAGFIAKDDVYHQLFPCLAKVLAGETWFPNHD